MSIELDYIGGGELHAKVCRTPRGKLYVHLFDEATEVHGESTDEVESDQTLFIPDSQITSVDQ